MSRSQAVALLLVGSGGFMDAFTFIAFDHVFTNAQSGNVVLFAVYAAQLHWSEVATHVPPMLAFFPGIFAARWLTASAPFGRGRDHDIVVMAVELAILVSSGSLAGVLPPALTTFEIAFASAMQNSTFKTVDDISYTSVVTTGNLRSTAEALFQRWWQHDAEAGRKASVLGSLGAAFAIGAIVGAILTWPFGKAAIACPVALIAAALVMRLREEGACGTVR